MCQLADWIDAAAFTQGALKLAVEHQHGVYDCYYIACAQSMNVPLITADKRLSRKFANLVPSGIINLYDASGTTA